MPYEGDSPFEAWEYWFDAPPSETVKTCLNERVGKYSARAVVEAIQITGAKALVITGETERLQYLSGVLRRKELEAILPAELVADERKIDIVRKAWREQNFSFPLSRKQALDLLSLASVEDLCALIKISMSWTSLKWLLHAVQSGMEVREIRALHRHADTWTEFRSLVDEVVSKRQSQVAK